MRRTLKIVTGSALAFALTLPGLAAAGTIKMIQVYNNLYNQAATTGAAGITPSNITVNYYNSATLCDTAILAFRAFATEIVGTGSNQKCTDVTAVKIIAGKSVSSSSFQIYNTTPVVVNLTAADFEHAIIVQDLGTGVTGTPAADGSIAPVFSASDGSVATTGTLGTILSESKLR